MCISFIPEQIRLSKRFDSKWLVRRRRRGSSSFSGRRRSCKEIFFFWKKKISFLQKKQIFYSDYSETSEYSEAKLPRGVSTEGPSGRHSFHAPPLSNAQSSPLTLPSPQINVFFWKFWSRINVFVWKPWSCINVFGEIWSRINVF